MSDSDREQRLTEIVATLKQQMLELDDRAARLRRQIFELAKRVDDIGEI